MIFQKYSQIGESLTTYFFRKYILYYIIKLDRKKYEQYRLLLLVRLKIMLNCPTMTYLCLLSYSLEFRTRLSCSWLISLFLQIFLNVLVIFLLFIICLFFISNVKRFLDVSHVSSKAVQNFQLVFLYSFWTFDDFRGTVIIKFQIYV